MTPDPVRVGLVGAGYFARLHLDAWRRLDGARLVAVCDRDPATHAHVESADERIPVYRDVATMLDAEELHLVDIATPPDTHLSLAADATARGLDIICQKPLAPTREDAARLVEECENGGVEISTR